MLFSKDPFDPSYYFPVLIGIGIFIGLVQTCIFYFKQSLTEEEADDATLNKSKAYSLNLSKRKDSLWFRYLLGYISARASMWAKSPYMYMLYATYHGFTIGEIGTLYAIDAGSALIFGPIFGSMADVFGRKKFSMLYSILVLINLSLRLTGIKVLAYVAQVVTGMGAGIVMTSFEAWVVFESNKEFRTHVYEKERFLKKLFKSQNLIDATTSIIVSGACAIFYFYFGIFAPILISMGFSLISFTSIFFSWDENKPAGDGTATTSSLYSEAFVELKKREVYTVGLMESLWQATLNIFIFAWTPLLQLTTHYEFNPGMIFICYCLTIICGTKLYEIFVIHLRVNPFLCLSVALSIEIISFGVLYHVNSFIVRFIMCVIINGICGFYSPCNSIIKSKLLKEKLRTLLMNLFRIPLNIYVIFVFFYIKQMNPFNICLLCMLMLSIALIGSVSLYIYPIETKNEEIISNDKLKPISTFAECSIEPNYQSKKSFDGYIEKKE